MFYDAAEDGAAQAPSTSQSRDAEAMRPAVAAPPRTAMVQLNDLFAGVWLGAEEEEEEVRRRRRINISCYLHGSNSRSTADLVVEWLAIGVCPELT